jgi:plasmid stabilization system protein ParE
LNVSFFEAAQQELEEAVRHYAALKSGLGDEFAEEVRQALERICTHPAAWTNLGEGIRRCRTNRFPYGLVYFVEENEIFIVAVMHLHRRPGYWRDRLDGG